jgi:hypothetical protein
MTIGAAIASDNVWPQPDATIPRTTWGSSTTSGGRGNPTSVAAGTTPTVSSTASPLAQRTGAAVYTTAARTQATHIGGAVGVGLLLVGLPGLFGSEARPI